jgi:hypothetical protein
MSGSNNSSTIMVRVASDTKGGKCEFAAKANLKAQYPRSGHSTEVGSKLIGIRPTFAARNERGMAALDTVLLVFWLVSYERCVGRCVL